MQLDDLIDPEALRKKIDLGHVAERHHCTLPLAILNYTARCQYANDWDEVTSKTRGLIYNTETGKIVARPFEKFFNLGQHTDDEIPTGPIRVLEKMDGSLGILYDTPDGLAIATRGSFHSEQAEHATEVLRFNIEHYYGPGSKLPFSPDLENHTYLFEIIYPANRIVVDYGSKDLLVLLDVLDIETGMAVPEFDLYDQRYYFGPHVYRHEGIKSLSELIDRDVPNAEGYVVVFDNNFRVKVKHAEYVRLHRILTNVTARSIYECIAVEDLKKRGFGAKEIARSISISDEEVEDYPSLAQLLDGVPDEFYSWVHKVVHRLETAFSEIESEAKIEFLNNLAFIDVPLPGFEEFDQQPVKDGRAEFAKVAQKSKYASMMFLMYDGKPYHQAIWKILRPEHEKPFGERTEDVS